MLFGRFCTISSSYLCVVLSRSQGPFFFFFIFDIHLSSSICWKDDLSLLNYLSTFAKNSIDHIYIYLFLYLQGTSVSEAGEAASDSKIGMTASDPKHRASWQPHGPSAGLYLEPTQEDAHPGNCLHWAEGEGETPGTASDAAPAEGTSEPRDLSQLLWWGVREAVEGAGQGRGGTEEGISLICPGLVAITR